MTASSRSMLGPAPAAFVDPTTLAPAFGAYAGPMPAVSIDVAGARRGWTARHLRRKRWVYAAIASEELFVGLAVVHTGFAATAFVFVYDRAAKRMLVDRTLLAPPSRVTVADAPHGDGTLASFVRGRSQVSMTRAGASLEMRLAFEGIELEATLDESSSPPPISAIVDLRDGLFNATEKRALASVRGRLRVGGRSMSLDGATAGWDYTQGLLPRRTRWRWAFALGKTTEGEPIGLNVVQGFVGEAECAAFFGGHVHPLAEPRFEFDERDPLRPWRIVGQGIDLSFEPGAVHAQHTQLLVVRSRFVQPVGLFRGKLELQGRDVQLDGVAGVVEDQDVLW
ncbi:hypothetical protein AKJ09_08608 [Labilithrix luteola]|uniref:DUF2804 domain-containing protein n=1 Tax=Labilithrix luteola TaxID=1391654 RepID=A0A0K1Q946_9BACT|nr:DUF2804 domain-containing protein [Labilithrix luteola]AKV01945.1 hypothetical protein AKJ09_08608 [Labilithrix luteola]